VDRELLAPALKNAVLIFFLLQTFVFIPADYVLFPADFETFLGARLALDVVLAALYFWAATRWPKTSSVVTCAAGGLLFLSMVMQTGGASSGYYVGMILLVIGMGVLTPQDNRTSLFISTMLFAGYAALPLYSLEAIEWQTFAQHCFFLGAACVEASWACAHMDRMRFADFKQQRQLEEARDELAELDRAKSRFSANVHHELRTPLTLILAPLDTLRSGEFGELSPVVQKTLTTMHANGRRLYKMINNLLDLSKVESNQFKIVRRPMQIEPLVQELVAGARALADRKGVRLIVEGFDVLPEINADIEALDKVLVNLVGNALKFTDEGDTITIGAACEEDQVRMCVADTGIGIPPEKVGSIFDRFAQVDGSATRRYEGTGIGLSLAKEMVEGHGGQIWAESEGEGRGTTIWLTIPFGEPDEGVDEAVLQDDGGHAHGIGRSIEAVEADLNIEVADEEGDTLVEMERSLDRWEDRHDEVASEPGGRLDLRDAPEVLIAEDNPDMRALLAMLVGKEFRVRVTKNGREALEALQESAPDLVLSDVMMPEMSGIDLCRAIKENELTRAIPVVLVTSKAEREMKIEGLELGADDYVTKPFHPRELLARVRALVRVTDLQKQLGAQNQALEQTLDELKQAEVQLVQSERLAAVGELAAGIAHEVNNPVNFALNAVRAMQGTVKDLRDVVQEVSTIDCSDPVTAAGELRGLQSGSLGGEPAELADTLVELSQIVTEGLRRTSSLVGDLRDFAVPGRASEPGLGPVDLEKGLRSTISLLRHALSERGAHIELTVESGTPSALGDAGGLNQVFLNLIKNAAECFGPEGGRIDVSLKRDGDHVVVEVSDDGPGIPEALQPRLFEPFFTTKETGEGTGLGLSITRQIVASHCGELRVESVEGEGTRFIVRLPLGEESAAESSGAREERNSSDPC
jgi:signal transduction histidine kinase